MPKLVLLCALTVSLLALLGCTTVSQDVQDVPSATHAGIIEFSADYVDSELACRRVHYTSGKEVDLHIDRTDDRLKVKVLSSGKEALGHVNSALVQIRALLAERDVRVAEEVMPRIRGILLRMVAGGL